MKVIKFTFIELYFKFNCLYVCFIKFLLYKEIMQWQVSSTGFSKVGNIASGDNVIVKGGRGDVFKIFCS